MRVKLRLVNLSDISFGLNKSDLFARRPLSLSPFSRAINPLLPRDTFCPLFAAHLFNLSRETTGCAIRSVNDKWPRSLSLSPFSFSPTLFASLTLSHLLFPRSRLSLSSLTSLSISSSFSSTISLVLTPSFFPLSSPLKD